MNKITRWLLAVSGALLLPLIVLGAAAPVRAQGPDSCPANVLQALGRAGAVCRELDRGEACYGYGLAAAEFQPGAEAVPFDTPGHIAPVDALRAVRAAPSEDAALSVAMLQIQADLVETEQRSVTLLLFGEAEVENQVPPVPELTLTAAAVVNIRAAPESGSEVIEQLSVRDTITANGRSEDADWLRVILPDNRLGWVSPEVVNAAGDLAALAVVEPGAPFLRPFQVITVRTGADDALCAGAPQSGLLLQTPNIADPVTLTLNGAAARLAGTVFLQTADDALYLNTLDGGVELGAASDGRAYIPAGARIVLPLDDAGQFAGGLPPPEPFDAADFDGLPLNNLPGRFSLPEALAQEQIDALAAAHFAPVPTPTPRPTADPALRPCVRVVIENTSTWSGPGTGYEVVNDIDAGTQVVPVFQVTNADGETWWQLESGHWLLSDVVRSAGDCLPVPVTDLLQPAPYNELNMARCDTANGPVIAGQVVTITFVPPGWDTLEEAESAPRWDPGTITVDDQRLRVRNSGPIRVAEARYIVSFSAEWEATPGTHRVVAERLGYELTCNLVVRAGP